ncbi:hypothetical protein JTB14_003615 [Gonioctena quinquepunctata]|nr:hypothetical protein JTB14_003615 [Gonioctena quinquepunctata]
MSKNGMKMLTKNVERMIRGPGATTWKTQNKTKKITAEYESIVNPPSVCSKLFSEDELRAGGDRSRNIDTSDDVIKECLPLKTIDGLLNLEDLLNNNKIAASQFMNKLVLVGGSDYKNLIRRCLQ